ncbi:MAG: hypothetical protein IKI20_00445 [Lachnospiraceae bacterium]|nr:hypothetical protein [Lachnospiraceae bacterium]
MKSKHLFRTIAIGILILLFCGCGKNQALKESEYYNKYEVDELWASPKYPRAEKGKDIRNYSLQFIGYDGENSFYLESYLVGSGENTCLKNSLYKTTGFEDDFHMVDNIIPPDYHVVFCDMNQEGILALLAISYLGNPDEQLYLFNTKTDSMINEVHINPDSQNEDSRSKEDCPFMNSVQTVLVDSNYLYVLCTPDTYSVYVYDLSLNFVGYKESDEEIVAIPSYEKYSFLFNNENYQFTEGEFSKINNPYSNAVPNKESWEKITMYSGNDKYNFFYFLPEKRVDSEIEKKYTGALIGVSKEGNAEKLFSFKNMGLSETDIFTVALDSDQVFLIGTYVIEKGILEEKYFRLKRTDEIKDYSVKEEKQTVIIAGLAEAAPLLNMIRDYNAQSEDYYVEYINYNTEDDYEVAKQRMTVDISSTDGIDAVLLSGMEKNSLIEKKALDNLYEYIHSSNVISEDDFVDFLFQGMQYDEKEMYSIYPEVSFEGIITSENKKGMDYFQFEDESSAKQNVAFEYMDSPLIKLSFIMKYSGNRFVDEKNKVLNFDEDFIRLLHYLNEEQHLNNTTDNPTRLLKNKKISAKYGTFDFPYSYFYYKELLNGRVNCTNLSNDGPIIIPDTEIGVLSSSKNKEAVYDFLDYMFTDENYHRYYGKLKFPVLKSVWNDWEIRLTAKEDYVDRFGETILSIDFPYSENDVSLTIKPVEKNDVEEMNELFKRARYIEPLSDRYLSVIEEEAGYYFSGVYTEQETCEKIENRLKIAIAE